MPNMMGKEKVQKKLLQDLGTVFRAVMKQYNLAPGDFPDLDTFRSKCEELNFAKFPKLKPKLLQVCKVYCACCSLSCSVKHHVRSHCIVCSCSGMKRRFA
jgi:Domain of unknown function (DUF5600)